MKLLDTSNLLHAHEEHGPRESGATILEQICLMRSFIFLPAAGSAMFDEGILAFFVNARQTQNPRKSHKSLAHLQGWLKLLKSSFGSYPVQLIGIIPFLLPFF